MKPGEGTVFGMFLAMFLLMGGATVRVSFLMPEPISGTITLDGALLFGIAACAAACLYWRRERRRGLHRKTP